MYKLNKNANLVRKIGKFTIEYLYCPHFKAAMWEGGNVRAGHNYAP